MTRPSEQKVNKGQQFGFWKILNNPKWNYRGEQVVFVKCISCGEVYRRYAYQFTTNGAKWGCKNCALSNKSKGSLAKNGMKKCSYCEQYLSIDNFGKNARMKDGYDVYCKRCRRKGQIKGTYNLDEFSYNVLLEKFNYQCGICGAKDGDNKNGLAIDHCHQTGEIRGLLCLNCNTALGLMKDDPELLSKAIDYLSHSVDKKYARSRAQSSE